eukprot:827869_1
MESNSEVNYFVIENMLKFSRQKRKEYDETNCPSDRSKLSHRNKRKKLNRFASAASASSNITQPRNATHSAPHRSIYSPRVHHRPNVTNAIPEVHSVLIQSNGELMDATKYRITSDFRSRVYHRHQTTIAQSTSGIELKFTFLHHLSGRLPYG